MELNMNFQLMVMIIISIFLTSPRHCYVDTDGLLGIVCNPPPENFDQWASTVVGLFAALQTDVRASYDTGGYYERYLDGINGLVQCRGDISWKECQDCTTESIKAVSASCDGGGGTNVTIWRRWCVLTYSDVKFFGTWGGSPLMISRRGGSDPPGVFGSGMKMMRSLAAMAPYKTLMFKESEIDLHSYGIRYGLAQCTHDLAPSDCKDCFNRLLDFMVAFGERNRVWEAQIVGCFMLYEDTSLSSSSPLLV